MASKKAKAGTRESPWKLKTPPGVPELKVFRDERLEPPALVRHE